MARYSKIIPMADTQGNIHNRVSRYLTGKKFKYTTRDGEPVFQKGDGVWVAASFIQLTYAGGHVRLEAWIDTMGSEQDLDGFVGSAAKKPLKKTVAELEAILAGSDAGYTAVQQPDENVEAIFAAADLAACAQEEPLGSISKAEYYKKYASDSFRKNMRITAIIGYVMCGIVGLTVFVNIFGLIDLAILLGLTLGMHLGRSRGCAIGILVYSGASMILTLISSGTVGGWAWLAVGICALILFHNEDKRYYERVSSPGGSTLFMD